MPTTAATQQPKLTAKQIAFAEQYVVDLNATAAAERAGYKGSSATASAFKNLRNPAVQAIIQHAKDERSKRTAIDADRTLLEYARIGFADIRRLFTPEGQLIQVQDLPDDAAAFVKKVKVRVERTDGVPVADIIEIDCWDKLTALGKIADHVGLANKQAEAVDRIAEALRNHARALPVSTARPVPVQRSHVEDAEIIDGEVQP